MPASENERAGLTAESGAKTHFGFRTVDLDDKQAMVDEVFHKVARRYDLMNDLMSGGLHRLWKDDVVTALNPPKRRAAICGRRCRRRHRRRRVPDRRGGRRRHRRHRLRHQSGRCWRSARERARARGLDAW